ncbi:MAG: HXXEE domain-containing protein [Saprospiraceae bacterium]
MSASQKPDISVQRSELLLWSGIGFTLIAIAFNFWMMGVPVLFLNAGLVISLIVWSRSESKFSQRVITLFMVAFVLMLAHLWEEYHFGFFEVLPGLFGRSAWPSGQFLRFNSIWLFLFILSIVGAQRGFRCAQLILWFFLLLGCIGNGVLHLGLTIRQGSYFPGAVSSAALFVLGLIILRNIRTL